MKPLRLLRAPDVEPTRLRIRVTCEHCAGLNSSPPAALAMRCEHCAKRIELVRCIGAACVGCAVCKPLPSMLDGELEQ